MKPTCWILSALAALFLASNAGAATLHVPADYPTIQAGVDAASPGDTVLVAPGTYTQVSQKTIGGQIWKAIVFLRGDILVRSEDGPSSTILDLMQLSGDETTAVAAIQVPTGALTVEGFTIIGAPPYVSHVTAYNCGPDVTLTLRDSLISGQSGNSYGVYARNAHVLLTNSTVRGCRGIDIINNQERDLVVTDCIVESCSQGISIYDQTSGALTIQETDFLVNQNAVVLEGEVVGGVLNCRFIGNVDSTDYGSACITAYFADASLYIANNLFENNVTSGYQAASAILFNYPTGGAYIYGNTITNSTTQFAAVGFGEDSYVSSYFSLANNIIDRTTGGPGVRFNPSAGVLLSECNVFWNNTSDILGASLGPTDRVASPQFCDALQGDYRVGSNSPCLPQNSNGCGLIGLFGEGCVTNQATITTSPLAFPVLLDGFEHLAPVEDGWVAGSNHIMEAPLHQLFGDPVRYTFLQWEDGSTNPVRTIQAPPNVSSYEAIYYYHPLHTVTLATLPVSGLTLRLDSVNRVTPYSFFAAEGETHQLLVTSPQFTGPADRYIFKEWEDGSTNTTRTVTIPDSDFTYSATFEYDPLATMKVLSSPGPGVTVRVDQVNRTTPFTGYYETSSTHNLFVSSPQNLPNGHQYTFKHWEDGTTNPNRNVVLGDSVATYTYTAFFDVVSEVAVTVTTNPPNALINVDGVDYQSPAALIWEKGTQHTLSCPPIIPKTEGTRYRFDHWSDNGAITHVVTAPASAATYTAFLTTQHQVFATAGLGGQVAPIPEWNDEGSIVSLQAFPDPRFEFGGWVGTGSGSYTGPNNPTTVTVLGPILETAEFTPIQFELSFSLSDSDPLVNTGSPLGFGAIYYWAICSGDLGIGSVDLDLDIQGLSVAAFVPSPGVLHTFDGTNLTVTAPDCMPMPGVIGTFYVTDPAGGRICADTTVGPGGIPSPTVLECKPSPLSYQGLHYTRIHGCRTDGAPACVAGNGCAAPPIAPPLLSLTATATDRAAEIAWAASAESKSDGYLIDRSAAGGAFERLTQSILPPSSSMRFVDEGLAAETEYAYRVLAVWAGIESSMGEVSVRTLPASSGTITALLPSRPNPFSDQTQIGFVLAAPSYAKLSIYDVAGRRVRTLADGIHPAGERHLIWEGRTDHGVNVTSGVYFLKLETPQVERISKLILRRQN